MPVNKSALLRYYAIDRCLTNKQHKYPTLSEIAEKCAAAVRQPVSLSCVEKDMRAMRESPELNYLAPIRYHKLHRGYYYAQQGYSIRDLQLDDEEWEALRYAAALLNQYKDIPLFAHFRSAIERINSRFDLGIDPDDDSIEKFVQYETANSTNGYAWLAKLYEAIRAKKQISFSYENIYKGVTRSYTLDPYMLKEIRNRWYVAGWSAERNQYLVFALDRMSELQTLSSIFKRRRDFNPDTWFSNTVGIMDTKEKPETVTLQISSPFDKLLRLEPLHPSQEIINEKAKQITVTIVVDINPELCLRLLGLGPACKVVGPGKLVKEMRRLVEEMRKGFE